jgi:hypothetical protein
MALAPTLRSSILSGGPISEWENLTEGFNREGGELNEGCNVEEALPGIKRHNRSELKMLIADPG